MEGSSIRGLNVEALFGLLLDREPTLPFLIVLGFFSWMLISMPRYLVPAILSVSDCGAETDSEATTRVVCRILISCRYGFRSGTKDLHEMMWRRLSRPGDVSSTF